MMIQRYSTNCGHGIRTDEVGGLIRVVDIPSPVLKAMDAMDPEAAAHMLSGTCKWTWNDDEFWETQCGGAWSFITGDPEQNGAGFCPLCGGELIADYEDEAPR